MVQEIETLLGRQAVEDLDLEALELAVRQQVLQLAGAAVEQRLNADTNDERGWRTCCGCGQPARFAGRQIKQVQSVLGLLRLERAYYHCSCCGHGFCPRDQHLGIANASLSPALTRMTGTVGALLSFQEGSELLTELAGVAVDAKQVERTAEALGKEIAADERVHTEPLDSLSLPQTLYLGMDGTGIPLRAEELVGHAGKQVDGSAKTGEVKLCTIWSAESRDEQGTPVRDEGSVTYSAALESASALDTAAERSPFAQRVWREATRRRFCQAPRRVVLGDGAVWIWNIAGDQFLDATQIVDRFHAKQHLSDLGKALYGPTAPRAAQWAERRKAELDTGKSERYSPRSGARYLVRGGPPLPPLFSDQPGTHALPGVPRSRFVHFHGRGGGRVQGGHRHPAQTRRNALDRSPFQRHHCSPLLETQWSLSGLLGTQNRMTHHFPDVHPRQASASAAGVSAREAPRKGRISRALHIPPGPLCSGSLCSVRWLVPVILLGVSRNRRSLP